MRFLTEHPLNIHDKPGYIPGFASRSTARTSKFHITLNQFIMATGTPHKSHMKSHRPMNHPYKKTLVTKPYTLILMLAGGCALFVLALLVIWPTPDLEAQILAARATLQKARSTHTVRANYRQTVPLTPEKSQSQAQKFLFLATLLPLIAVENDRIRNHRKFIKSTTSPAHLNAFAIEYGLKPGQVNKDALLRRIDVLPESLVLAQAAIESAWGNSRFAREGNAYFGERTYNPGTPGMAPKRASGFKVKSFTSAQLSVRSYMHTINSHRAYRTFRHHRAALRAVDEPLTGHVLALQLKAYSELGSAYIKRITDTISANTLSAFDGVKLTSE